MNGKQHRGVEIPNEIDGFTLGAMYGTKDEVDVVYNKLKIGAIVFCVDNESLHSNSFDSPCDAFNVAIVIDKFYVLSNKKDNGRRIIRFIPYVVLYDVINKKYITKDIMLTNIYDDIRLVKERTQNVYASYVTTIDREMNTCIKELFVERIGILGLKVHFITSLIEELKISPKKIQLDKFKLTKLVKCLMVR